MLKRNIPPTFPLDPKHSVTIKTKSVAKGFDLIEASLSRDGSGIEYGD
jgi:hypothetical protein